MIQTKILIGNREFNLIRIYKNRMIAECDGVIHVIDGDSIFVVGLDDSKLTGNRQFNEQSNNTESAVTYIDYLEAYHYVKHREKGYLAGWIQDEPIFNSDINKAILFKADEAVDIAFSIDDGESIQTGKIKNSWEKLTDSFKVLIKDN